MLSESTRRQAMLAAAESAETRLSGKVTLVQETHGKVNLALLMYLCTAPGNRSAIQPNACRRCAARLQPLPGA